MNKQQKLYALAKAHLETLEALEEDLEQEYIAANSITNADGKTPSAIYCIDDQEAFDHANEEFSELPEVKSNWDEILVAREALEVAENQLIAYGLSIVPANVKETLSKAVKTDYTTRIKVLDLAFRLDAKTVRA